jgi:hypothetical protein
MCHMGAYVEAMSSTPAPTWATLDRIGALRRLREAEDKHDEIRRTSRAGVTVRALAADARRWEALGEAIAALAGAVARQCAASHFCDARPDVVLLAIRLSEAIDDLMDAPAWTVTDAAARLAAADQRLHDHPPRPLVSPL